MNGRMAKKLRRTAPLILMRAAQRCSDEGGDMSKLPSVRQTYRMLKRRYTRGT